MNQRVLIALLLAAFALPLTFNLASAEDAAAPAAPPEPGSALPPPELGQPRPQQSEIDAAVAAENERAAEAPLPEKVVEGEQLEPTVTIRREEDRTIEEHRSNGKLYMVVVKPDRGPSYTLLDTDGDGTFDDRRGDIHDGVKPVYYKVKDW